MRSLGPISGRLGRAATAAVSVAGIAALFVAGPAGAAVAVPAPQCIPNAPTSIANVTQAHSNYLTQLQPSTAWPIARGSGALVALLDTGVAQAVGRSGGALAGRLVQGASFAGDTDPQLGGLLDCDGQGTADAALVAATDTAGPQILPGIAPDARVLSIRVLDDSSKTATTTALTQGITAATAAGAGVIVVATPCAGSPALAAAVKSAVRAGIVVVAAVRDPSGGTPTAATYPAGYPGVLAVAAAPSTAATTTTSTGTAVDLVAPGSQLALLSLSGHGYTTGAGNALAAALVGGTAALVRSAYPKLSLPQLTTRLEYSADHASGTIPDPSVGWGTVNPYAALALPLDRTQPPTAAPESRIAAVVLPPKDNPHHRFLGAGLAAGLLIAALAASAGLGAFRRGRRRGWKVAQPTHR